MWPGVSSKALGQRRDAQRRVLWKWKGKLTKRCLTGLQQGEQAKMAPSQWEGGRGGSGPAKESREGFLVTEDQ